MWQALAWLRMGTGTTYTSALQKVLVEEATANDGSISRGAGELANRIRLQAEEVARNIALLEELCMGTRTRECYYFGCQRDAGHYWWDASSQSMGSRRAEMRVGAQIASKIDGGFCPGVSTNPNRPYDRTRPEVEGEAALHYVDGWTILGFWDRSVDKRGACNSNFIIRGHCTFDEVLQIAREQYPQVMGRLKFEIQLVPPTEPCTPVSSQ
jgi:hypothetical protein